MSRLFRPAAVLAVLVCLGFIIFGAVTANWMVAGVFAVIGLAAVAAGYTASTRTESDS